ncbi:sugar-binding domain-containing protein [Halalkalibacterium halodurans]|uniref:Transcriptional regulator n=1 Tax=Halalkalibacterium halodurans (strain ATCC BAA-125 / DSM 18197 / FERM 7344 / JCM 9153 / C-125) TaxID=272558 RepID=Q9K712_HALH5|nr:sugar-binding domain-containing protein [Halalkalibacterium halodurans]MDY7224040.1 sugar-binding domain-containing protein [Halalkalibacterium halodurans]MDY7243325.1 sugar-binding domain-containing protein [Halalkalibacterium halodurans]MED3646632.1 sugar-binding domain-containing protein [Halalkalibacterium halodurans]MED4080189.1 sugar-binding domain-containing protein [Halalkalibacterium halodurans]MED4083412.1 sugar-binding domain-containing protein [Halalkalibacterium halodurans]
MDQLIDIQRKLAPDVLDIMIKRYRILQYIRLMQPIGRRSLSSSLAISERVLRGEVTFLKDQGLLMFAPTGMYVTAEGEKLYEQLEGVMKELLGLRDLEAKLRSRLGVKEAIVVPGDSDAFTWVKRELGRACIARMKEAVKPHDVIAVMGGTTLAAVAEMMTPDPNMETVTFVPARGGLGEQVENQANTISAQMAGKAGANYKLLHVPDQLSEETYASLIAEPGVRDILEKIKSASMVIHGIGEANTMALRRGSSEEFLHKLTEEQVVAEAFGYYFDKKGTVRYKQRTIGLQLDTLDDSKLVISVAGGASKAEAISAYMNYRPSDVLITDEEAAKRLLSM